MIDEPDKSIVGILGEIEKEIAQWHERIRVKEAEAEVLNLEINELNTELSRFQTDYHLKVGILYAELDRIKLQIEEYRYRCEELKKRQKATAEDLGEIEEEIENNFSEQRRRADNTDEETEQAKRDYEQYQQHDQQKEELDPELLKDIKALFRKLALQYHPDKAQDEQEKERFHEMMAAINDAYENNDIETLREYMLQAEKENEIKKEELSEKLERLKTDYDTMLNILDNLKRELSQLTESKTYHLRDSVEQAKQEGRDLLEELAKDVKQEISKSRTVLDELIDEYKSMIENVSN